MWSAVPSVRTYLVMVGLLAAPLLLAQQRISDAAALSIGNLSLDQVLANLEERDAQRALALQEFEATRVYRMKYRGFPTDRDAEMVVKVRFHAPNSKDFTVVSETGSKFVTEHIFKKLLEEEAEALRNSRYDMALTRDNYKFKLAGFESDPSGGRYVLELVPKKSNNRFLYRGKIWVDAKDFAVVRIEGEPAKNPSFWIKKTEIAHSYKKVDDFWLPAENHTESFIRLGGKASLSIEYRDYKITKSIPTDVAKSSRKNSARSRAISGAEPAIWTTHIVPLEAP